MSEVTRSLYLQAYRPIRCGNPTAFIPDWLPKRQVWLRFATPARTPRLRTVGLVAGSRGAFAWVESPLQLLCAVEYASLAGIPVRIVPRAGALQLTATSERLRSLELPPGVEITEPHMLPLPSSKHWIIGDAWSGVVHSLLAVRMPQRLTVVDDGSASLRLPRALAGRSSLSRSGRPTALADLAAARLRSLDGRGALELFSYYRLDHPARIPNRFGWLSANRPEALTGGDVVLGSASVVDGLMSESRYLDWVSRQPRGATYFPHRRESLHQLEQVASLGLTVETTGLPIELVLAGGRGLRVTSLPSSAVDSLRILLAGTGSIITVDDLERAAAA